MAGKDADTPQVPGAWHRGFRALVYSGRGSSGTGRRVDATEIFEKKRFPFHYGEGRFWTNVSEAEYPAAIERLFVDLFLEAYRAPPRRIVLDLDATDDPLYGEQEGRHFHGYYDCYCYLPLYIFCGRHLLAPKLRSSANDAADGAPPVATRIVACSDFFLKSLTVDD